MWIEQNPNPDGKRVGDCAVRAIALALDVDWDSAYLMIVVQGFIMKDMPSSNAVWGALLKRNGFRRYAIPDTCPDCYTVEDFANDHRHGIFVVGTGSHVVTVRDGHVMDSWDSSSEIPQYYWFKED